MGFLLILSGKEGWGSFDVVRVGRGEVTTKGMRKWEKTREEAVTQIERMIGGG